MKKTKFMIAASALTFAAIAAFAHKSEVKFAGSAQASTSSTYGNIFSGATNSHLTKVFATGLKTAFFKTINGTARTMQTVVGGAKLYYKP